MPPTKESKRVMEHRKAFDRVDFLVPLQGKEFIKAMAWLHGLTLSDFLKAAILEKAGLNLWPDNAPMADTRSGAFIALRTMQAAEYRDKVKSRRIAGLMYPSYNATIAPSDAQRLRAFCAKILSVGNDPFDMPVEIELSAVEVQALRRVLSIMR